MRADRPVSHREAKGRRLLRQRWIIDDGNLNKRRLRMDKFPPSENFKMWTGLLLLVALVSAGAPPETPKPSTAEPSKGQDPKPAEDNAKTGEKPPRRVDKNYRPAIGDRVVLYDEDEKGESLEIWATTTPEVFLEYLKAEAMENAKRSEQLEKEGKVLVLDDETPATIMAIDPVQVLLQTKQVEAENAGVGFGVQTASDVAVTVRILDGPHKGKLLYTSIDNITRFKMEDDTAKGRRGSKKKTMVKQPKSAMGAPQPAKPLDATAKAASLLRLAQNLEKSGKRSGALEFYRKVITQYPNTPGAKTASERIKALEKP